MLKIDRSKILGSIWTIYCLPFCLILFSLIFFCVVGMNNFTSKGNESAINYFQGFYKITLKGINDDKTFSLNVNGWIAIVLLIITLGTTIYAYIHKHYNHVNTKGSIISTVTLFVSIVLVTLLFVFFISAAPSGKWSSTTGSFIGGKWSWITTFPGTDLVSPHQTHKIDLSKGGIFVEAWSIITGITIGLLTAGSLFRTFKK